MHKLRDGLVSIVVAIHLRDGQQRVHYVRNGAAAHVLAPAQDVLLGFAKSLLGFEELGGLEANVGSLGLDLLL